MLSRGLATGILVCIFGGLSTALWGAFSDITSMKVKHTDLKDRVRRVEQRTYKRLERIETKLDEIREML